MRKDRIGTAALGIALTVGLAAAPLAGAAPASAATRTGLVGNLLGTVTSTTGGLVGTVTATTGGLVDGLTGVVGTLWGDAQADDRAKDLFGRYDARRDYGSLRTVTEAIGARRTWLETDRSGRAITGRGVTVAVVDSGVSAVPGLDAPGKVVRGPDLSLEANAPTVSDFDTYGHGTHMASIIAGADPVRRAWTTGAPDVTDPKAQLGVAPDARLLALKLATTDGSADVSQVIAALDWVVAHRNDNGLNVRVVNLSYGTKALQPYQLDPLAAAAENAWRHGLVVVVSGGNQGPGAGGLTNPAIDPYVLAVGASDPRGSVWGWADPTAASFTSRGTAERHVDLLAPGRSIVGLRDPGSFVDVTHPEGRVDGDTGKRLFRGSGTSQAAAVVSGAAALLLQAYPDLTPDEVKAALVGAATPVKVDPLDGGAGALDVDRALDRLAAAQRWGGGPGLSPQRFPAATGVGSLEKARGGSHLVDPDTGAVLAGEVDVQGKAWDAAAWSRSSATVTSWSGGVWRGARWSGDDWTTAGWARARWSGEGWSRARWMADAWDADDWSRARWMSGGWERARWMGGRWS
jgi:serine protease AprX